MRWWGKSSAVIGPNTPAAFSPLHRRNTAPDVLDSWNLVTRQRVSCQHSQTALSGDRFHDADNTRTNQPLGLPHLYRIRNCPYIQARGAREGVLLRAGRAQGNQARLLLCSMWPLLRRPVLSRQANHVYRCNPAAHSMSTTRLLDPRTKSYSMGPRSGRAISCSRRTIRESTGFASIMR
jgi:hypothetical protein